NPAAGPVASGRSLNCQASLRLATFFGVICFNGENRVPLRSRLYIGQSPLRGLRDCCDCRCITESNDATTMSSKGRSYFINAPPDCAECIHHVACSWAGG